MIDIGAPDAPYIYKPVGCCRLVCSSEYKKLLEDAEKYRGSLITDLIGWLIKSLILFLVLDFLFLVLETVFRY